MLNEKWHKRFLDLAEHVAQWSKDPSTKVGSVITDGGRKIVSLGYNGLPMYVDDVMMVLTAVCDFFKLCIYQVVSRLLTCNY